MILIENSTSGERQCVISLEGYGDDWAQIGPELPEGAQVDDLALIEGEWCASPQVARDRRWEEAKAYRDHRQQEPRRHLL